MIQAHLVWRAVALVFVCAGVICARIGIVQFNQGDEAALLRSGASVAVLMCLASILIWLGRNTGDK